MGTAWRAVYEDDTEWMRRSACKFVEDKNLFNGMDQRPGRDTWHRLGRARLLCSDCPVRAECLAWGQREMVSGIYGGEMLSGGAIKNLAYLATRRGGRRAG